MAVSNVAIGFISLCIGCIVVAMIQSVGHQIYGVVNITQHDSKDDIKKVISSLPLGAFIFIELSYVLGSLVCGMIVSLLEQRNSGIKVAVVNGFILTAFGIINVVTIPHPLWFTILSLITFLPCVYIGYNLRRFNDNIWL